MFGFILSLLFGLLLGSFLNVVILRLNTGRSIVKGRSRCARCDRPLEWFELVPLFSFIGLRGKCRTCKGGISFQYPFVELFTSLGVGALYLFHIVQGSSLGYPWIELLFSVVVYALLIILFVYDVRHKILPNTVTYSLIILSLLRVLYLFFVEGNSELFLSIVSGLVLTLPFFFIWYFSKGKAMGFGDVKLALAMGIFVGFGGILSLFLFSFWIGSLYGLLLITLYKRYRLTSEVPFAPFLIIAFILVAFFNITLEPLTSLWL